MTEHTGHGNAILMRESIHFSTLYVQLILIEFLSQEKKSKKKTRVERNKRVLEPNDFIRKIICLRWTRTSQMRNDLDSDISLVYKSASRKKNNPYCLLKMAIVYLTKLQYFSASFSRFHSSVRPLLMFTKEAFAWKFGIIIFKGQINI